MSFIRIIIISIGLAMDAFAVSVCEGVNEKKTKKRNAVKIALFFGGFQALMPMIGYYFGHLFYNALSKFDHWIAFGLLNFIGIKMLFEAFEEEKCEKEGKCSNISNLLFLAIATSIDALAVGFTFSFLKNINIFFTISIIGIITFLLSFIGVIIGNKFGKILNTKAQILGACILILIGIKFLFEDLFK